MIYKTRVPAYAYARKICAAAHGDIDGVMTSPSAPSTHMEVSRAAAQARMFDIASAELAEIKRYFGAEEKTKLDYHGTSLRNLSRELDIGAPPPSASWPDVSIDRDYASTLRDEREMKRGLKTLAALTSAAFQCRGISIQVGFPGEHYAGFAASKGQPQLA